MNTLIITGGNVNKEFLQNYLQKNKFEKIIAADKGLEILNKLNVKPAYIIGDFDSVNKAILEQYKNVPITYLKPEKDFTDTHMALKLAIEEGAKKITIAGATGTRLDHTIANIHILKEALEKNVKVQIINENNRITLINKNTKIKKDNNYKYVSLIPLTTDVKRSNFRRF
ncbi:MAG: thiamine diphosphokinase [Clostridia bacterium]|nr:thiamine diphosphokinase [Clostridia bacterium]